MFKKNKKDVDRYHFGFLTIEKDRHIKKISLVRFLGFPIYINKYGPSGHERKLFCVNLNPQKTNDLGVCHEILNISQQKVDSRNYISLIGSPSGETYLFLGILSDFLAKERISDYVLVVNSEWKRRLCMFLSPKSRCYKIDCDLFVHDILKFTEGDVTLYNIFPTTHYLNQDKRIVDNKKTHYYDCVCRTLGVPRNDVLKPSVSEVASNKVNEILSSKNIDPSKIVILCPEANSCSELTKDFWETLSLDLMKRGYIVFLNSSDPKYVSCSISIFLTHEELFCLAQQAAAVVGLRSGLIEILASSGTRIFTFYGGFPERGLLKAMSADDVLRGFSLKKLPGLPYSKIFEYSLAQFNCEMLVKDLQTRLPNYPELPVD